MTYYEITLSFKVVGENDYDALLKADAALKSYGLMYVVNRTNEIGVGKATLKVKEIWKWVEDTLKVEAANDDEGKAIEK
jgi:hypothetical protein